MPSLTRRDILVLAAGFVATNAAEGTGRANATPSETASEIAKFTNGKTPEQGRISVELPEIAENGNAVPLSIDVDHPMTAENHVTDVLVVADGNPAPRVASFQFTPLNGRASAATRIRLAGTQTVTVIARTNEGKVFTAQRQVKVTIGGCGG